MNVGELKALLGEDDTKVVVVSFGDACGYCDIEKVCHEPSNPIGFAPREPMVRVRTEK